MGRVSGGTLSPDGKNILYGVTYYNMEENKGSRDIYIIPVAGGTPKKLVESTISEFGEVSLTDPDLYENIADLICEKKKLSKNQIEPIVKNIEKNVKLIDLRLINLPEEIIEKMNQVYNNR
jgi:hypothetical protein